MKLKLSKSFLSILIAFNCNAQQPSHGLHVKFIVSLPDLANDSSVYIAGNIEQLGFWNAGKEKMNSSGNNSWTKEITVDSPLTIEYKYTLGSWDREGATANGSPLPNFSVKISHDTTISNYISYWKNGSQAKIQSAKITGTVRYYRAMSGSGIMDRDVVVWLPPGYDENKNQRYPVLYMQDGENIFDPSTSSFGTEWRIDESCDSLIKIHAIRPLIVVGIYNTLDRSKEYEPGEKGEAYMNFVVKKLKPFIDSSYRTLADAGHTITGGSSAGANISFMLAWEYNNVFSRTICMSPAFKIEDIDLVKMVNDYKGPKKKIFIYAYIGGKGLDSQLRPGLDSMIATLKAKGYRQGKNFVLVYNPDAKHFEADWGKQFPQAIGACLMK